MAAYTARALVLKRHALGEADLIVTFLAEDGRQLRAVAKGARKPTSRLAGRLQQFGTVDLLLHSGRNLDIVREAETVHPRAGLRENLERSAGASAVSEFLDKVSLEGQAEERGFALAEATLDVIDSARPESVAALVGAFIVKGMALHGYRPQLGSCVACGGSGPFERFSMDAGGVLCAVCGGGDAGAVRISQSGLGMLGTLLMATMTDIAAADLEDAAVRECLRLLHSFGEYHLHVRLKALAFFIGMLL